MGEHRSAYCTQTLIRETLHHQAMLSAPHWWIPGKSSSADTPQVPYWGCLNRCCTSEPHHPLTVNSRPVSRSHLLETLWGPQFPLHSPLGHWLGGQFDKEGTQSKILTYENGVATGLRVFASSGGCGSLRIPIHWSDRKKDAGILKARKGLQGSLSYCRALSGGY